MAFTGLIGALAAVATIACGTSSRAATTSTTALPGGQTTLQARTTSVATPDLRGIPKDMRVTAAPASCAHVAAGDLSSVVTFAPGGRTGAQTYTVDVLGPTSTGAIQSRAVRVGAGGRSTINLVWHQASQRVGDVRMQVVDQHGRPIAVLRETHTPLAARCT